MSTRGAVGFLKDEHLTTLFQGCDAYPGGLGNDVLDFIRRYKVEDLKDLVDGFLLTDDEKEGANLYTLKDFWAGEKKEVLVYDDTSFAHNSLHCEWLYIINLDLEVLEIYKGFNEKLPVGRFRHVPRSKDRYYAVTLVKTLSFDDLPPELHIP